MPSESPPALSTSARAVADEVDLYDRTYGQRDDVLAQTRRETFVEDVGQNSWIDTADLRAYAERLRLDPSCHVLEIATGAGGPTLYLAEHTGCRITGIDVNPLGVEAANEAAAERGLADRVSFAAADATQPLPFSDESFDAVLCIDSANHLPDRSATLSEWKRLLRPSGRLLWTDPVVIAGPVTNAELLARSSIGLFLFVPPGENEKFIAAAGLDLLQADDETAEIAGVAGRWYDSRARHRQALLEFETQENYDGLQAFFAAVRDLTSQRRLLRIAYLCERRPR